MQRPEEHEYDGAGRGLKAAFLKNGGKACAIIQYFDKDAQNAPAVGLDVLMNPQTAAEVINLFRSIMGRPDVRYVISVGFLGLRGKESPGNAIPSVAEFIDTDFLRRRAYISDEVSISVTTIPSR